MSSFHGLFFGKTASAARMASASGVLKSTGLENFGIRATWDSSLGAPPPKRPFTWTNVLRVPGTTATGGEAQSVTFLILTVYGRLSARGDVVRVTVRRSSPRTADSTFTPLSMA